MRIAFDNLVCRSAFDLAPARSRALRLPGYGTDHGLRAVELEDVLYLPDVLEEGQSVCLVDRRIVPTESVLDPRTAGFLERAWRDLDPSTRPYAGEFECVDFERPSCVLGNLFSRNFGHWTEELLKVVVLERSGAECTFVMPKLPSFAREFLNLLGIGPERILELSQPTRLARAVFSTAVSHENISTHPISLELLRQQLPDVIGSQTARSARRRLWLDRGTTRNGGVVTNRGEVEACLKRFGFEAVDLATMPVAEQLNLVRGAVMIAGAHGSQFVHAQFMPERSAVIECFSPIHVNPSILQICRVLKHEYRQIVSRTHVLEPYGLGRDCRVDCEHLELVLDSL